MVHSCYKSSLFYFLSVLVCCSLKELHSFTLNRSFLLCFLSFLISYSKDQKKNSCYPVSSCPTPLRWNPAPRPDKCCSELLPDPCCLSNPIMYRCQITPFHTLTFCECYGFVAPRLWQSSTLFSRCRWWRVCPALAMLGCIRLMLPARTDSANKQHILLWKQGEWLNSPRATICVPVWCKPATYQSRYACIKQNKKCNCRSGRFDLSN